MRNLIELPEDILIPILAACDIETIFTVRLTCVSLSRVIDAYIRTIAPKSARNTYPNCKLLLQAPTKGYSLAWLRSRIPAQLASIVLDKDKLRRTPCVSFGFPNGIPSESDCDEAVLWRKRIANGWRVLRSLHLISKEIYSRSEAELRRPNMLRRASSGVRGTRLWQVMSCSYPGCTQHGIKHIFDSKSRRHSETSSCDNKSPNEVIQILKQRESIILEKRLGFIQTLPEQDLLSYTYLWRLLHWTFRPYSRPEETVWDFLRGFHILEDMPRPSWQTMISDIWQGCSWLNWFVLHVGPSPFIQQWTLDPATHISHNRHLIRNMIWKAWSARTSHQIEVEREYVCNFEFALRKRCLSPERYKRLAAEISQGRSIRTVSLDCIPWNYDHAGVFATPQSGFPWYKGGQRIWMDGDWYLRTRPGVSWRHPYAYKQDLTRRRSKSRESVFATASEDLEDAGEQEMPAKGPLAQVPYLVYLAADGASKVWPEVVGPSPQFAF